MIEDVDVNETSKTGVGGTGDIKYSLIGEKSPATTEPLLAYTLNLYYLREVNEIVVVNWLPAEITIQFSTLGTPNPSISSYSKIYSVIGEASSYIAGYQFRVIDVSVLVTQVGVPA